MIQKLNKGISTPIAIAVIVILIILAGGTILGYQYYYIISKETPKELQKQVETSKTEALKTEESEEPLLDETADWKTYRNEEYGFKFDYPENYFLKQAFPATTLFFLKEGDDSLFEISIDRWYKSITEGVLSRCAADGPKVSIHCDKIIKQEKFINKYNVEWFEIYANEVYIEYLSEAPWAKTTERVKGPIFVLDISEQSNRQASNIFFNFSASFNEYTEQEREKLLKTLKKMISTFRPISWKIYRSDKHGFEIKYPKDFIVDENYIYHLSSGSSTSGSMILPGVSFGVPASYTTGTNLSRDTKISVEFNAKVLDNCTADNFFREGPNPVILSQETINDTTFSKGYTADTAAGSSWFITVYSTFGQPFGGPLCFGIRSHVRSGSMGAYYGTGVKAYDSDKLKSTFEEMVSSFRIIK